jgi:hypothetical protein
MMIMIMTTSATSAIHSVHSDVIILCVTTVAIQHNSMESFDNKTNFILYFIILGGIGMA